MNPQFLAYMQGNLGGGSGYNPYAAGAKQYPGGYPNAGGVDPAGYKERDAKASTRRNALLRRLQAQQSGNYGSAAAQRPIPNQYSGPGGF